MSQISDVIDNKYIMIIFNTLAYLIKLKIIIKKMFFAE